MTLEKGLADLACGIRFERLPSAVVDAAKNLLLDSLGCALGATECAPARIAEEAASRAWPGGGRATILRSGARVSAEVATLVNGSLIRYLDFNDIYEGLEPIHPSENIAVALACCEEAQTDGKRLVEAIVVGYEGHIRLANAYAFMKRGLHPVSAAGWVAPMIAGKAWDLEPAVVANAIGLSGTRSLTLTVISRGDISMAKATGYALPSMDGVFSARLAAEGFTGPTGGLQWLFEKVQPLAQCAEIDLDPQHWGIVRVSLKRFAVQYELQSVVEACVSLAKELRDRRRDIVRVTVGTSRKVIDRCADTSKYSPNTRETADHSLPVCAALALLDGRLTAEQFEAGRWNEPAVRSFLARVEATVDEDLVTRFPKGRGARVTLTLADGSTIARVVEVPEGDFTRPLSARQVQAKFVEQSAPVVGEHGARRIIEEVGRIDRATSLQPLLSALNARIH